jgi:hypothetical protein
MFARQKNLILIVLLTIAGGAMAASSRFVVITPKNEVEHPFMIKVRGVAGQGGWSRVRVVGDVGAHQRAWLVVCKYSVGAGSQNFRGVFWFDAQDENIERYIQLFPEQTALPESGDRLYPYVEAELPDEQMRRAYIYIDYPHPVDDGGDYYSIDLAYYLEGSLGKKSEIEWGAQ